MRQTLYTITYENGKTKGVYCFGIVEAIARAITVARDECFNADIRQIVNSRTGDVYTDFEITYTIN